MFDFSGKFISRLFSQIKACNFVSFSNLIRVLKLKQRCCTRVIPRQIVFHLDVSITYPYNFLKRFYLIMFLRRNKTSQRMTSVCTVGIRSLYTTMMLLFIFLSIYVFLWDPRFASCQSITGLLKRTGAMPRCIERSCGEIKGHRRPECHGESNSLLFFFDSGTTKNVFIRVFVERGLW